MAEDGGKGLAVLDTLGDRFLLLIGSLIRGNRKRALMLARDAGKRSQGSSAAIVSQNLIEEMAQAQAVKNSLINLPSVVPGLGTIISFSLLGVENFFLLDQSIALILALCHIHGKDIEDQRAMEEFAVRAIAEVFGVAHEGAEENFRSISRDYMTKLLPRKYFGRGVDRGMRKILSRLMPAGRRTRLFPAGIGLGSSAVSAYDTIVNIGQTTLRRLPRLEGGTDHGR
ncbi:MAG: hypothetical protein BWZ01_01941 [Deltaproteobacteria bacterium ADurb.BinA179]|jgi:hypothetical protein|nr:MAG: hypothetical protein BWZ01_01941 [Deltaproteobacteria bacterium ADurb.BinA179]HNR51804.1 hypothetical protein [Deltaproteobacteria bacterium]HOD71293.1 hypothetical protein [Deltaproteobacteria bacterium]HOE74133.1 hypothetical protein [Deltaproteobacteria bacterium]HPA84179.1 hypothetical protein [Deltaproteobacteria bacterium]